MTRNYVEFQDNCYRIEGTRVSLDSIVYSFQQGLSPETIANECFPSVTLEQVYGAIAYYLANRDQVDAYLKAGEDAFNEMRKRTRDADPVFYQKFMQARRQDKAVNT